MKSFNTLISLGLFSLASTQLLTGQSFDNTKAGAEESVQQAVAKLDTLRTKVATEKIPLSKELNALESEVIELRRESERQSRLRDTRGIDLNALEANVKAREEEMDYIQSLVTEYLTSLETRADPSELPSFIDKIDAALLVIDNPEVPLPEALGVLATTIGTGMDRMENIIGGTTFPGEAVSESGQLMQGDYVLFGPAAYFVSSNKGVSGVTVGGDAGIPTVLSTGSDASEGISSLATSGEGLLPLDPTLGKAIAIASTDETLIEHILKGGVWIFPILFFALLSLSIALFKAIEIFGIKTVRGSDLRELILKVRDGEKEEAIRMAKDLPSPSREMLMAGVQFSEEPKELLEEILLEKMIETQPKVERLLSIISVTAATAPLLGLLGTVTGMINTFKLITIFGTGDAKSLSSGISEALITTEFGLIVAIPSLILHAILSRKAKAILGRMEACAMTFINGVYAGRSDSRKAS